MSRFYIVPYSDEAELPKGVALKAFVKTSGDTVAVVYLMEAGGLECWRNGKLLGTFESLAQLYKKLNRMDV